MRTSRQNDIFWAIWKHEPVGIKVISEKIVEKISIPTINRALASLKQNRHIIAEGSGPGTKYRISPTALIHIPIDVVSYFKIDTDDRKIITRYNPAIFKQFNDVQLFTTSEITELENSTAAFREKMKGISSRDYKREFERLMIELSWKSSQIEGNTYDLLDTEQLLKYNIPAANHTEEEAMMLLNHKSAIEYIREHAIEFSLLTTGKIIDIHSLLIKDLNISKTLRKKVVRITGTNYLPPDNAFIIEEAVEDLCQLLDRTENVYSKALVALLFISYIQPFDDGNKRTARLIANALLMASNMCPLSYRSISPSEYKKSILLFYELNNISAFKKLFVSQYQFAVENYF